MGAVFRPGKFAVIALLLLAAAAQAHAARPEDCRTIPDDGARLKCYDRAVDAPLRRDEPETAAETPPRLSLLSEIWDISSDETRRVLHIRSHRVNYFLPIRHSDAPDSTPMSPTMGTSPVDRVSPSEAKFQISIKTRILQGLLNDRLDIWAGYSQQAHWQVYSDSSPFREVNFEPEVMALWRTGRDLPGGLTWRFVNFGLVHHSNGRGGAQSRSWNRVYAQFGLEYGDDLALTVKPWWRVPEPRGTDNNPDMQDYWGRIDVTGLARLGEHGLELTLRNNLRLDRNRGAFQGSWYFPLYRGLKGYFQLFTGYGESLIDYNHVQTTLGLGVAVVDWM